MFIPAHMKKSISHNVSHWNMIVLNLYRLQVIQLYCSTTVWQVNVWPLDILKIMTEGEQNASCTFFKLKRNGILWHSV